MIPFILWYVAVTLVGLLAFPLAYRLFPALADRGYALSRTLGLLIWGYFFWLLASLGILRNDLGGNLMAVIILISLSLLAYRSLRKDELFEWWNAHRRVVLAIEALFFIAFAVWTFVRSTNPEIMGTEKPMELAFINAILNSPTFPPHDPWLSGYAISYYYFGYVLIGMLAKITAVPGNIAFNLGVSLVFALSAIGVYSLVYTLLQAVPGRKGETGSVRKDLLSSLFGPLFVLIAGNLEGFLDMLHARGLFWRQDGNGQLVSSFWSWLDVLQLDQPPAQPFSWIPSRYIWWWRASRVVQDYDLAGNAREIIDEFPFFSYLLADLHPHVLAMPFAFLAIGIALNLFLGGAGGVTRWLGLRLSVSPESFLSATVILGGMAFLNTWDFPIYVFLFCSAYILWKIRNDRSGEIPESTIELETGVISEPSRTFTKTIGQFLALAFALGVTSIIIYLPFYVGFSSQAGGILPNLIYPTRGAHLWIMFGAFFIPILLYLLYLLWSNRNLQFFLRGLAIAAGLTLTLWFLTIAFGAIIASLPVLGDIYVGSLGSQVAVSNLILEAISRRLTNLGWVTLTVLLGLGFGFFLIWRDPQRRQERVSQHPPGSNAIARMEKISPAHGFVVLLVVTGLMLVLFTEFFFLRDQFGYRINTIFKFYYQAWLLLGIAAAFGVIYLLKVLKPLSGMLFRIGLILITGAALTYPVLSLLQKTSAFAPPSGYSLDGAAYLEDSYPDDMAGVAWLKTAPTGVVLEAVGPQYSDFALVATFSGHPTVLGWPGHESQWRGGGAEMGSRQGDVERIYRTSSWEDAKILLDLYNVRYVFVGSLERNSYPVNENKFMEFLEPVFNQGQVTIYEIPREIGIK